MAKKPKYCWDSSAYLAWLRDEKVTDPEAMVAVLDEIEKAESILIAPVLAYTEILDAKSTPAIMAKFRGFMKRSNIHIVDITLGLAEKAEVIRSAGLREKPARKIKTADAIFVASAILFQADALHTFDDGLLKLNGSKTVDGLCITKPKTLSGSRLLC